MHKLKRYSLSEGAVLELIKGDLTKFTGDAIVNAGLSHSILRKYTIETEADHFSNVLCLGLSCP